MSYPARFSERQFKNWLKCRQSLKITKEALHDYTDYEVKQLHGDITQKVSSISCDSSTRKQCGLCSAKDIRWTEESGYRNWSINCKNNICDKWLQQILAVHSKPHNLRINWKNADISQWPVDCYEVAKIFMPIGQVKTGKMPDDLDASAILSLFKYCNWFRKDLPNTQIISDLIDIRNKLLHSGEMRVADVDKENWMNLMMQLLCDLNIHVDTQAELEKLKKEDINITFGEKEKQSQRKTSDLDSDLSVQKSQSEVMQKRSDSKTNAGKVEQYIDICDKLMSLYRKSIGILDSEIKEFIRNIVVGSFDWKKTIQEMSIDTFCKEKLERFLSVKRTDSVLAYLLQVTLAKNSEEALCVIMASINKKFKEDLNDNNIAVWLGLDHTGNKTGELVLVCFHSADTMAKFSQLAELRIIYKRHNIIEREPLENRLQEKHESMSFTKHDVAAIKQLISEHGKHLFAVHSNLEAISASPIRSTKHGIINETSIVLYCRLKGVIPYGEKFFPKVLEVNQKHFPTDIREGFFSLGMMHAQGQQSNPHPNFVNNPLRMGCSIGASGFPFAGTLGPFIRIDNDIGFLTCAHVLGINSSSPTRNVVQPSDIETGQPPNVPRICGTFIREQFDTSESIGVDAALVRIDQTQRVVALSCFVWKDSNQPKNIGMFDGDLPSFVDGEVIGNPDMQKLWNRRDCCKFGRSTGLTQGLLLLENAMLKVHDAHLSLANNMPLPHGYPSNNFIMKGQFLIQNVGTEPFFAPGDSGSGVYVVRTKIQGESRLALIGIAIGSLATGECVMTPIGRVLEALQLEETDVITEGCIDIDS